MRYVIVLFVLVMQLMSYSRAADIAPKQKLLVFSKTAEYRHDSIPDGIAAIRKLADQNHFLADGIIAKGHRRHLSRDAEGDTMVATSSRLALM